MKKIKKAFISFGAFMTSLITKVSASSILPEEIKYGVFDPEDDIQVKYGVYESPVADNGKIVITIVLFTIGLFVVLSKKITKKVKVIVVSILAILLILGCALINYFVKHF